MSKRRWVVLLVCAGCGGSGGGTPDANVPDAGAGDATVTADATTPAQLAISPTTRDFGSVVVGSSGATVDFTISNSGGSSTGALTVGLGGTSPGDFAIVSNSCGAAIGGGASCVVSVRLSPTTAGAKSAALTATATPGGSAAAALTGAGLPPGSIIVAPTTHDFGALLVGATGTAVDFTVTNGGSATTGVLSATLTGSDASAFHIATGGCGAPLTPSATCTVSVTFAPTAAGARSASLVVTGTPGGSAVASLTGSGLAPAMLTLAPSAHDFGNVLVGQNGSAFDFTVMNTGGAPSGSITTALAGADRTEFGIVSNACPSTLAGGASCVITVRMNPTGTHGARTASLGLSATPGGSPTAQLTGAAQSPALLSGSAATHDFGTVDAFVQGASFTFTVTNSGDLASGVPSAAPTGSTGDFTITNGCTTALAPAATCDVMIRFTPTSGGAKTMLLPVTASPGGTASITVTGTGRANVALTVIKAGGGTGTVTATPVPPSADGISCGSDCSGLYVVGSRVTLQARTVSTANSYFQGWSGGGCTGSFHDCTVTMDAAKSVTATFALATNNLVFVTSNKVSGNFAALAGTDPLTAADATCQTRATAAGLPGTYTAWFSANGISAKNRLGSARSWLRLDGRAFGYQLSDFLAPNNRVLNPIQIDENGAIVESFVWTSTNADGTEYTASNCNAWTTTTSTVKGSPRGSTVLGPTNWTSYGSTPPCNAVAPFYCFMTNVIGPPPPTVAGKLIFQTAASFGSGGGIAAAHALCQAERPVGSTATFKALLSTTTVPASTFLNPAANYVRPDGQLVGTGATLIAGSAIPTGIWQFGNGTYHGLGQTWGGAGSPAQTGTVSTTCDDWTSPTGTGNYGDDDTAFAAPEWWFSSLSTACDSGQAIGLHCVEQ